MGVCLHCVLQLALLSLVLTANPYKLKGQPGTCLTHLAAAYLQSGYTSHYQQRSMHAITVTKFSATSNICSHVNYKMHWFWYYNSHTISCTISCNKPLQKSSYPSYLRQKTRFGEFFFVFTSAFFEPPSTSKHIKVQTMTDSHERMLRNCHEGSQH